MKNSLSLFLLCSLVSVIQAQTDSRSGLLNTVLELNAVSCAETKIYIVDTTGTVLLGDANAFTPMGPGSFNLTLKPGRIYSVDVSTVDNYSHEPGSPSPSASFSGQLKVPAGYSVYVAPAAEGAPSLPSPDLGGTVTWLTENQVVHFYFVVVPDSILQPALAGKLARMDVADLVMEWGLGTIENGQSAGRIQLRDGGKVGTGYGFASTVFQPGGLDLVAPFAPGQAWTTISNGRQLETKQVQVKAIRPNAGSDLLTLSFFAKEGTGYAGSAYATYTIERISPDTGNGEPSGTDGMRITEVQGSVTVTRKVFVNTTDGSWTLIEGTGTERRYELHNYSTSGAYRLEDVAIKDGLNGSTYAHRQLKWLGTRLLEEKRWVHENYPIIEKIYTTTYAYYDTLPSTPAGDRGMLQSVTQPNGMVVSYHYYGDSDRLGQIQTVTDQWSVPGGSPQSRVTTYDYNGPAGQFKDYLGSAVVTINGQEVSHSDNGLDFSATDGTYLNTSSSQSSSSESLVTHIKAYRKDADYFLAGRPISILHPTGLKQVFAYVRGTINGTDFSPGSTGNDYATIILEGYYAMSASGSVTVGNIPVNYSDFALLDKISTATVVLRNADESIAHESVYVWSNGSFTGNLIADNTTHWLDSVRRADTTALNQAKEEWQWEGAYLKKHVDAAGIVTDYGYDTVGRQNWSTQAGVTTDLIYSPLNQVTAKVESGEGGLSLLTTYSYDELGRFKSAQLPDGRLSSARYNLDATSGELVTTEVLPCGSEAVTITMRDGKVGSVEASSGNEYYTYDVGGAGITTTVHYGSSGSPRYIATLRDRLGRVVSITRPGPPAIGNVVDALVYDGTTGLLKATQRTGYATEYREYDAMGRPTFAGVDLDGSYTGQLDVGNVHQRISRTVSRFDYSNNNWWVYAEQFTYPYEGGSASSPLSLGVVRQQLTGLSSGGGRVEEQDRFGQTRATVVTVTRSAQTVTTTQTIDGVANSAQTVSTNGRLTQTSDPTGRSTVIGYDSLGRRHTVTDSRNGTTTCTYVNDRVATIAAPGGTVLHAYAYDAVGRVIEDQTPAGTAYYHYDCGGRLTAQWGAQVPTRYFYNVYGERTGMRIFPTGNYADAGAVVPSAGGNLTTWDYDSASGVLLDKIQGEGGAAERTDYTYNSRGLVATITQARTLPGTTTRVMTTLAYRPLTGELASQSYNDSGLTDQITLDYYRSGLLRQVGDGTGTRTFAYNTQLQLDTETLDATWYGGRKLVRQYDANHRPVGFTLKTAGAATELQQTYHFAAGTGLLDQVTAARPGASRQFDYGYVSGTALVNGLMTGSGANQFQIARTYAAVWPGSSSVRDVLTRISATYGGGSAITQYDYTHRPDGRRDTVTQSGSAFADYGASIATQFGYDAKGQLTSADSFLGTVAGEHLSGRYYRYGYDNAGNRVSFDQTGATEDPNPFKAGYTSDAFNQLVGRTNPYLAVSGTAHADVSGISVNGLMAGRQGGHWAGEADLVNDGAPVSAAVTVRAIKAGSPQDQGQTVGRTGVLPPKAETLTYDGDGNLTEDGLWTYTYNARNELVGMATKLSSGDAASRRNLTFAYDYLGRRIRKTVTDPVTSATTIRRYIYDGWNLVAEYGETGGAPGALQRSYTWGLDVAGSLSGAGGVGALVQMSVHGSSAVTDYYPTYDGNGNVAALVKSDGTLAAAYEYDPFGQVLRREVLDSAVADNPFGFSTKFTDGETGLVYYGHRYYAPSLGRFINRDPIGEQGGLNLYAFVGNDPVNDVDALGLKDLKDYLPMDTPGDIINSIRDYLPRGGYFIADKVKGLAYWSLTGEGTTPNGIADIFPAAQVAEYLRVIMLPKFEVKGDPTEPAGGMITINRPGASGGGGGGSIASSGGGGAASSSGVALAPNKTDCAKLAALKAQAQAIKDSNGRSFGAAGQYSPVLGDLTDAELGYLGNPSGSLVSDSSFSPIDNVNLTLTVTGAGAGYWAYQAGRVPTQTTYNLGRGMTGYTNVIGRANVIGGASLGLGIAGVTVGAVATADAFANGDVGGGISNLAGTALGGLALVPGPIGVVAGGSSALVNGSIALAQARVDARAHWQTVDRARDAIGVMKLADNRISAITQEMTAKGCK